MTPHVAAGIRAEHRRAGDRGGLRGHRADASGSTPPSSASSSRSSRWPAEPGSSSTSRSGCGRSARGSRSWARFLAGVRPARRARPLDRSVLGVALIAGGLALAWRQGGSFRADAPLSYGGLALAAVGTVVLLSGGGTSTTLLAPGRGRGRAAPDRRPVGLAARARAGRRAHARGSGARSAPTSPRASTTRCCRRSR